jgi:hypothetical protein
LEELLLTALELELELDCLLVLGDILNSEWGHDAMLDLWRQWGQFVVIAMEKRS